MLEEIVDNDILYRRIPNVHLYEDGTVKSVCGGSSKRSASPDDDTIKLTAANTHSLSTPWRACTRLKIKFEKVIITLVAIFCCGTRDIKG